MERVREQRRVGAVATIGAVAAYVACTVALPPLRQLLDDHRAIGRILLVVVALGAGLAASSPRAVPVRSVLLLVCGVASLLAIARDAGWSVELRGSAALSTFVLVAVLVAVQPRVPRIVAALVLAAIAAWIAIGLVTPYPDATADSAQSWLIVAGAALGLHLARPR